MTELGPEAQALIEAARAEAPKATLKHAVKASVVAKATSGAKVGATALKAATIAKVGAAAAVVAVAGWVALSPGGQPEDTTSVEPVVMQEPPSADVVVEAPEDVVEAPEDVAEVAEVAVDEPMPEPGVEESSAAAVREARPATRRVKRIVAPEPVVQEPVVKIEAQPKLSASSLAAETRLVESMTEAASSKNWRRVMFLANAHAEQFPAGLLAAERLVLTARAACALDDLDAARRARQTLVETMPESTFVAAVDAACPNL